MATFEPYTAVKPGELITAGFMNEVQVDIKKDIADEIEAAKEDLRKNGVDKAKNADEFAGDTPAEWTDKLDERYAPKNHDHQGLTVWRRYIKQFTPEVNEALIVHELGRYPIVDTYVLDPVVPTTGSEPFAGCKILLFSGHADADALGLRVRVYRERALRGIPFEQLATEVGLEYTDESSIADVADDFWGAFTKDPNDEIGHCQTEWFEDCCQKNRTVGELKSRGDWDDLHVALNPRKTALGADLNLDAAGTSVVLPASRVQVAHVNYSTLYVKADPAAIRGGANGSKALDLMFLLRI
jgi:hypothetical protein